MLVQSIPLLILAPDEVEEEEEKLVLRQSFLRFLLH